MNGVFLNKNRIPANTPTILRERDILGVGAIETTEPDYYVFNVLKNTVKDENEVISAKLKFMYVKFVLNYINLIQGIDEFRMMVTL